jgi:hypothetical protein
MVLVQVFREIMEQTLYLVHILLSAAVVVEVNITEVVSLVALEVGALRLREGKLINQVVLELLVKEMMVE